MPTNNPGRSNANPTALLEAKLDKLEKMLAYTLQVQEKGDALDERAADQFLEKVERTIAEVEQLDRSLPAPRPPVEEEQALKRRIQDTVDSLVKANLNLITSIQAKQAVIGNKIVHLKMNKDLLDTYHPQPFAEPMLVDSNG